MTSKNKDLAVPDEGPLSAAEVAEQVAKLRAAQRYVRDSATEAEALDAKRQAEVARAWVRIHKAAGEVATEACRLQATALRRLCQLGSGAIKGQERIAGAWMASMDDEAFSGLMTGMRYAKSPITLYKEHLKKEADDRAYERGREIADGDGAWAGYLSVRRAAGDVLNAAMSGGAVTVNELTEELAHCMDIDLDNDRQYLMREGIESVIREALRNEPIDESGHPDFVTWKDVEAGWLRIPWAAATVDQLRWMSSFRQEQARELKAAADELTALADDMERTARLHGLTRLNDVWRALTSEPEAEAA